MQKLHKVKVVHVGLSILDLHTKSRQSIEQSRITNCFFTE